MPVGPTAASVGSSKEELQQQVLPGVFLCDRLWPLHVQSVLRHSIGPSFILLTFVIYGHFEVICKQIRSFYGLTYLMQAMS
jgi:hypothetical protein